MKLFVFIVLISVLISCIADRNKNASKYPEIADIVLEKNNLDNKYAAFDEPTGCEIAELKSYLMAMFTTKNGSIWNILSIRQNENGFIGFHKEVKYEQLHSIYDALYDTTAFQFTVIRFNLDSAGINQVQKVFSDQQIWEFKDSLVTHHLDGQKKELIVFNGKQFKNVYRSYGTENEVEADFRIIFEKLQSLVPNKLQPFYLR